MRYFPYLRPSIAGAAVVLTALAVHAHISEPRTGRIAVLNVPSVTSETLGFLVENHFDIDDYRDGNVRIYATDDELRTLDARGIPYTVLEYQPNPPKFDPEAKGLGVYHSYATLTTELHAYAATYPSICRLYSIGNSYQGRALWVLRITDNPTFEEDEPEFKYISTIHGDEPLGVEMCLYFIDLLLTSYGTATDEGVRITNLINTTDIAIMPLMNPDALTNGTRNNAQGYDLNRNFPSYIEDGANGNIFDGDPLDATGRPTEVQRVMQWTADNSFTLSANFHGGALVANYPYDEGDVPVNTYAASPDDDLFIYLAETYTQHNTPMWNSAIFPHGISNGSDWYTIYGGMQDWNYRYVSCNDITMEISTTKRPTQSSLPTFWADNKESMLSYLEQAHIGIRGVVTDAATDEPVYAKIEIAGRDHPVYTDPDFGDYHRVLLPGVYDVTCIAPGYVPQTVSGVTVESGAAVRINFELNTLGEGEGEGGIPFPHTADQNGNGVIGLTELLRVIQFYNSGRFHCQEGTEDGYDVGAGDESCSPHDSDYDPQDWRINMSELLRLIQFHNYGGYHPCPEEGTEDGFCPGVSVA